MTRAQAVSPATRAVLDAMCDGEGLTMAVIRHAALEIRAALALAPVAVEAVVKCPTCFGCGYIPGTYERPDCVDCGGTGKALPLVAKEPAAIRASDAIDGAAS